MSRFFSRVTLATAAVAIVVLCAQIADAQGGGGGGGRQGGRQGGRAGGRGFGQQSVVSLAANPTIQELVKVTDAQKTKIEEANTKMTTARTELFQGGGGGDPAEMAAEMQKLTTTADEAAAAALDEAQTTKVLSALIQVSGGAAANNAILQKRLKVTDEQKTKLTAAAANRGGGGRGMRGATPEEIAAAQAERDKTFTDVLTADQKAEWAKIKDALKLTDEQLAGLRGGGARGAGRGRGRNGGGGGGGGGGGM